MKFPHIFAVALLACPLFAFHARAAQVDVTGTNFNVGVVQAGQYGSINTTLVSAGPGVTSNVMSGALLGGTEITFTYTGSKPFLAAYGDYVNLSAFYQNGATDNYLFATNGGITASSNLTPYIPSGSSQNLPVSLVANLAGLTLTETLANNSSSVVDFSSYFLDWGASLCGSGVCGGFDGGTTFTANYSVSAVPLPSSVILFGSAIVALTGLGVWVRMRKQACRPN